MTAKQSPTSLRLSKPMLLLILAAFLTGCSTFFEEAEQLKAALSLAEATKQAEAIVEAKAPPATLPELPADIRKCLAASKVAHGPKKTNEKAKQKAATKGGKAEADKKNVGQVKSPSADALVLARLEAARKRDACARRLLEWYNKQQAKPKVVAEARK